jgi:hypothetical protein
VGGFFIWLFKNLLYLRINEKTMLFKGNPPNWIKKKMLIKLYEKSKGLCAVCGCETEIQKSGETVNKDNTATFGHLYSKNDIRRYCKGGGVVQLECFKCNKEKDIKEKLTIKNNYDKCNDWRI